MTTVLCVGTFDPFHIGHLHHFVRARAHGDVLVVGVTRDEHVNKGPKRPVFNIVERMDVIRALAIVDDVVAVDGSTDALEKVKPQVFALGREYQDRVKFDDEVWCFRNGCKVVFTDGPVRSSSKLLEAIGD